MMIDTTQTRIPFEQKTLNYDEFFKEQLELGNLRALSWKNPFAEMMLHNKVETRVWYTTYRGLVMICSSKAPYSQQSVISISGENQAKRIKIALGDGPIRDGMAIAIGVLYDCRAMQKSDENSCFVEYNADLFCHFYENVKPIVPIPWKGSQGWRTVTKDIIKQIQFI